MSVRSIKWIALFVLPVLSAWLGVAAERTRLGQWIELRSYDLRFRLRGPLPKTETEIVVVAVDEATLDRILDPLILWQSHFAEAVSRLRKSGARAIGIDVVFGSAGQLDPQGEQALVAALLEAERDGIPTILAYGAQAAAADRPSPSLLMALGPGGFGFANLTTDSDDFVRRQNLRATADDGTMSASFASALAASTAPGDERPLGRPRAGDETIWINYRGRQAFTTVPFWQLLASDGTELRRRIEGNIVLLGMVTDGDLHPTPLYYWPRSQERPGSSPQGSLRRTPGVMIHAHTLSTLLDGPSLEPPSDWVLQATAGVTALAVAGVSLFFPFSAGLLALMVSTGLGGMLVMEWSFAHGVILEFVSLVVAAMSAFLFAQGLNYRLEGREKQKLRRLFQRYVSPEVVQRLVDRPEALALEGERRKVSVLFSDIRGFTSLSERLPAEELVLCLNRYLTVMVEIIHRNGGMVDKFIGDAIMAIFGAPLPATDHAARAVKTGCDMQAALVRLNRKFEDEGIPQLTIGVGVHSGEAVIGNVGSPDRMEYTVIGDTVNVASRIESLCKRFGPCVLISAATRSEVVDGAFAFESVGDEFLKGRAEPVSIFRVTET